MTTATKEKGLHAKLAEVMAEAERIPKNGTAPAQMGGYRFVQVGDAADFIRKALGSRGVSMLPTTVELLGSSEHTTSSQKTMTTVELRVTWTLTDGETGQAATIQSYGVGADTGDKYSGKATTSAMKYALLSGFLLSTGDDVEQGSDEKEQRVTGQESEDLLGKVDAKGKAVAGGSERYKGEWHEGPEGYVIGFRLSRNGDKDIPQVLVMGDIGRQLQVADPGASFVGQTVRVKGRMYAVKSPGRTTYNRLIVGEGTDSFIETDEWRIPALDSEPPAGQETEPEAAPIAEGQVAAFDVDADLDAVAEKALA